jgi:hypothetical protein
MANVSICDVCKRPTKRVVFKLFLADKTNGGVDHSDYGAHADVGECCGAKITEDIRWTKRKKVPRKNPTAKKGKRLVASA